MKEFFQFFQQKMKQSHQLKKAGKLVSCRKFKKKKSQIAVLDSGK